MMVCPPTSYSVLRKSRVPDGRQNECEFRASIPSASGPRSLHPGGEHYRFCFPKTDEKLMADLAPSDPRHSHLLSFSFLRCRFPSPVSPLGLPVVVRPTRYETNRIGRSWPWKSAQTKRITAAAGSSHSEASTSQVEQGRVEETLARLIANSLNRLGRSSTPLSRKRHGTSQESGDSRQNLYSAGLIPPN
jgi:hypothetical protein